MAGAGVLVSIRTMDVYKKNALRISIASSVSIISILGLTVLAVNIQAILGPEWDNDGPSNLAFFGLYYLPCTLLSVVLTVYALIVYLFKWKLWPSIQVKAGLAFVALLPVILILPAVAQWVVKIVKFRP